MKIINLKSNASFADENKKYIYEEVNCDDENGQNNLNAK